MHRSTLRAAFAASATTAAAALGYVTMCSRHVLIRGEDRFASGHAQGSLGRSASAAAKGAAKLFFGDRVCAALARRRRRRRRGALTRRRSADAAGGRHVGKDGDAAWSAPCSVAGWCDGAESRKISACRRRTHLPRSNGSALDRSALRRRRVSRHPTTRTSRVPRPPCERPRPPRRYEHERRRTCFYRLQRD